jgi:TRAP-type transport system small permease protein
VLKLLTHLERGIGWVCQTILAVSMTVIFTILCVNTILRYATGSSLQWANEVPELLFPWLVMAGVVLAAQHGAHITTSFLLEALPGRLVYLVKLLGMAVVVVLCGVLAYATFNLLDIVHDERSPILGIRGSVTYGCVMVGLALLALHNLIGMLRISFVKSVHTP